ncbi:DUF1700 domain-containing protein [Amphibacillus sp. Q70]|uniref:DUF1700 domain-containing protein n=1 Tax=Amphibacillus sp. Q70 TaxID=3453416 RepID=UPI003F834652
MNQKRYLQELAYHLRSLPKDVRDDIIEMYRDQFKIAELEGRSEEDTILLMGRAKANAEKELAIHADQLDFDQPDRFEEQEEQPYRHSTSRSNQKTNIPVLIVLIFVNLIFVLGPALGIYLAGLGLWVSSIIMMATPVIAIWRDQFFSLPEFYPVLATFGLGVLLFVAMYYLGKLAHRLIRAYFNGMSRLVKG